jgi:hypothetical protein
MCKNLLIYYAAHNIVQDRSTGGTDLDTSNVVCYRLLYPVTRAGDRSQPLGMFRTKFNDSQAIKTSIQFESLQQIQVCIYMHKLIKIKED